MTSSCLVLVAALCGSACVAGDDSVDRTLGDDGRVDITSDVAEPGDPDVCELLPDCGPCSLACDIQALSEQYVPPGTCVAFACTLSDGRQIAVHACHS
ncbi:MAG TPA: hypothetical protein VLB44_02670 [Kofleriaceae bacterium]|nr:hypothetical protein [Kofleriaceae bacterium]